MSSNQWMIQLSALSSFEISLIPTRYRPWIHVTLNQQAQLNALDLKFFEQFQVVLLALASNDFGGLFVSSSLEKAFCAGGNVKALLSLTAEKGAQGAQKFFNAEYSVDEQLYSLNVPYIALIPGICFGGGMGFSQSADLRIGLDTTTLSMPEVFIGLFADVGANKFLQHLPLKLRRFLVHTGARLNALESLQLNLLDEVITGLSNQEACQKIIQWISASEKELAKSNLKSHAVMGGLVCPHDLSAHSTLNTALDDGFQEIYFLESNTLDWERLVQLNPNDQWLAQKIPDFSQVCRLSVELQHRLFRNENLNYSEVFKREFDLAVAMTLSNEFKQGVQSKLIDKTSAPAIFQRAPCFDDQLKNVLQKYGL